MNERLQSALQQLRLSGLAQTLDVRLQEAAGHQLSHAEFLELILQDELLVRQQRQIDRRVKAADFRELKPLDDFDLAFQPVDQAKPDLRPGDLPLHPRSAGRAARRPAGHRQVILGPGDRLPGDQAGHRRARTARSSTWSATSCTTRRSTGRTQVLTKYLKPDLLIIDDMGMKNLPQAQRGIPVRDHHAAVRNPLAR